MENSVQHITIKILNDLFFTINQLEINYYPYPVYNVSVQGVNEFLNLLSTKYDASYGAKETSLQNWITDHPVDKAATLVALKQHKLDLLKEAVHFMDANSKNPLLPPQITDKQELLKTINTSKQSSQKPLPTYYGPSDNIFNLYDYQKSGSLSGFLSTCSNTTIFFSQALYSQLANGNVMGVLTMYNNFYNWYYSNTQPLLKSLGSQFDTILNADSISMPSDLYETLTSIQGVLDGITKFDPNNLNGNTVPFHFPGYGQWNDIVALIQGNVSKVPEAFTKAMTALNKYCVVTSSNDPSPNFPIGLPSICFNLGLQAVYHILNTGDGRSSLNHLSQVTKKGVHEIIHAKSKSERIKAIDVLREDYCVDGLNRLSDLIISLNDLFASGDTIPTLLLPYLVLIRKNLDYLTGSPGPCPIPKDNSDDQAWKNFANEVAEYVKEIKNSANGLIGVYDFLCKSSHQGPCTDTNLLAIAIPILCNEFSSMLKVIQENVWIYIQGILDTWQTGPPSQPDPTYLNILHIGYPAQIAPLIPMTIDLTNYLADPTSVPIDIFMALQDVASILYGLTGYTVDGTGPPPSDALTEASSQGDFNDFLNTLTTYMVDCAKFTASFSTVFLKYCPRPNCPKPPQLTSGNGDAPPICYDLNLQAVNNLLSSVNTEEAFYNLLNVTQRDVKAILKAIPKGGAKLEEAVETLKQDFCVNGLNRLSDLMISFDELYASGKPIDPNLDQFLSVIYADLQDLTSSSPSGGCPLPPPDQYKNKRAWEGFKTLVEQNVNQILNLKNAFTLKFQYICQPFPQDLCSDINLLGIATPIFCNQMSEWLTHLTKGGDQDATGVDFDIWAIINNQTPSYTPGLVQNMQQHYADHIKPFIPITVDLTNFLKDPSSIPVDIFMALQDIVLMLYSITGYNSDGSGTSPAAALTPASPISDFHNLQTTINVFARQSPDLLCAFRVTFLKHCTSPNCPKTPQLTGDTHPIPPGPPPICHDLNLQGLHNNPSTGDGEESLTSPHICQAFPQNLCSDINLLGIATPIFCNQISGWMTLLTNGNGVDATGTTWDLGVIIINGVTPPLVQNMQQHYADHIKSFIPMTVDLTNYLSNPTTIPLDILNALKDIATMLYSLTGYTAHGKGTSPAAALTPASPVSDFKRLLTTIDMFASQGPNFLCTFKIAYAHYCSAPTCPKTPQLTTSNGVTPPIVDGPPPVCYNLDLQAIYHILNSTQGKDSLTNLKTVTEKDIPVIINALPTGGKRLDDAIERYNQDYCINGLAQIDDLMICLDLLFTSKETIDPTLLTYLSRILADVENLAGSISSDTCPIPTAKDNKQTWEQFASLVNTSVDDIQTLTDGFSIEYSRLCNTNPQDPCADPNLLGLVKPIICKQFTTTMTNFFTISDANLSNLLKNWLNPMIGVLLLEFYKDYEVYTKPLIPLTVDITNYLADPINGPTDIYIALQDIQTMLYFLTGYTAQGPGPLPSTSITPSSSASDLSSFQATIDLYKNALPAMIVAISKAFLNHCPSPACSKKSPPILRTGLIENNLPVNSDSSCTNKYLIDMAQALADGTVGKALTSLSSTVAKYVPEIISALPPNGPGGVTFQKALDLLQYNYNYILTVDIRSIYMQIQLSIFEANPPTNILEPLMDLLDIFSYIYNSQDSTDPFPFATGKDPTAWSAFQTQFNIMIGSFTGVNQAFLAAYKNNCLSKNKMETRMTAKNDPPPRGDSPCGNPEHCDGSGNIDNIIKLWNTQIQGLNLDYLDGFLNVCDTFMKFTASDAAKAYMVKNFASYYDNNSGWGRNFGNINDALNMIIKDPTSVPASLFEAVQNFQGVISPLTASAAVTFPDKDGWDKGLVAVRGAMEQGVDSLNNLNTVWKQCCSNIEAPVSEAIQSGINSASWCSIDDGNVKLLFTESWSLVRQFYIAWDFFVQLGTPGSDYMPKIYSCFLTIYANLLIKNKAQAQALHTAAAIVNGEIDKYPESPRDQIQAIVQANFQIFPGNNIITIVPAMISTDKDKQTTIGKIEDLMSPYFSIVSPYDDTKNLYLVNCASVPLRGGSK